MSMLASSGSDFILEGLTPCCYGGRKERKGRRERVREKGGYGKREGGRE